MFRRILPPIRLAAILLCTTLAFGILKASSQATSESEISTSGSLSSTLTFQDVTVASGIDTGLHRTWGLAWSDYDNDGWPDLFVSLHAHLPVLYHNDGDGTFTDVTMTAGMAVRTDRHGCAWGDYDADHFLDLYCSSGAKHGTGSMPNQLFRNNKDGTFTEVAVALGVDDGPGRGRSVNWFDYNGDGKLDLFVTNIRRTGYPSRLYRNLGGTFEDVATPAGVDVFARRSSWADYDNDGDDDMLTLYPLALYKNRGNGTFVRTNIRNSLTAPDGTAWADFDNDGDLDFFVAAYGAQGLYRNLGDGTFQDVTSSSGIANSKARLGVWGDFDNDGDLDLFVVNTYNGSVNTADALCSNNSDGTFSNIASAAGVRGPTIGSGDSAAWADYDEDGFLDLFVTNGEEGQTTPKGPLVLYRNLGNANHWLELKLRATGDNFFAYGTKVWARSLGKTQFRQLTDNVGGSGQSDQIVHFGLGDVTLVDEVAIQWPNGATQRLTNVAADQIVTVTAP